MKGNINFLMPSLLVGFSVGLIVAIIVDYIKFRKTDMPYRESEIVTNKAPSYTWSFKLGMLDAMKLNDRRETSLLGDVLWGIFFVAGLLVFGFGCFTAKAVIAYGVDVPWVKRELIVWCISLGLWLVAFVRPYISREPQ